MVRKATSFRQDLRQLRRLAPYLRPHRKRLVVGLVTGGAFGVLSGYFPRAIQIALHGLFSKGQSISSTAVMGVGAGILLFFVARGALGYLSAHCLNTISADIVRDLRIHLFTRVQRLSMAYFVRQRSSRVIQAINREAAILQRTLVTLTEDVVRQPVTIVAALAVLACINPWFFALALGLAVACLFPTIRIGRKVREASRAERTCARELLGVCQESVANIAIVKAYQLEAHQQDKFRAVAEEESILWMRIRHYSEMLSPLIEVLVCLGLFVVLSYAYLAGFRVTNLVVVVGGFYMMYGPLKSLGRVNVQLQMALAASESIFRILDEPITVDDRRGSVALGGFSRSIRYEDVSLRYDGRTNVLVDIDLDIPCGSVCAIVGPSGAGKSSLVGLLLRYYDPTRGRILLDEHDLRDLSLASIRQSIGLVTQDTMLFADTVANNIGYGKPGATRPAIITAAQLAHAHDYIMAMPAQYDTVLADRGQNLSGGQRQRIAIARAFLKNPAILVLDEATSSLDAESQHHVQAAIADLMRGRTVLVIAHRLSTVQHADRIVVLDQGRIVETGTHAHLVAVGGLYRRLYEPEFLGADRLI